MPFEWVLINLCIFFDKSLIVHPNSSDCAHKLIWCDDCIKQHIWHAELVFQSNKPIFGFNQLHPIQTPPLSSIIPNFNLNPFLDLIHHQQSFPKTHFWIQSKPFIIINPSQHQFYLLLSCFFSSPTHNITESITNSNSNDYIIFNKKWK